MPSTIDSILEKIGVHFGVISRHSFTSLLMKDAAVNSALETPNVPTLDSVESKIAAQLLSIAEGGLTTEDLIREINSQLASADPADKQKFCEAIRICYEPQVEDSSGVVLKKGKQPAFSVVGPQGRGNENVYSMRHISGINTDESTVNLNVRGASTLSVIQVFKNRLSPANRDMGALTFFMNAIPTLEVSRAVPFIDVVLIQQGSHLTSDNRVNRLSMGQFLLGNTRVQDPAEQLYLSANDSEVALNNEAIPEFEPSARSQGSGTQSQPIPISTAGMELFTSPQTLVPANEMHREGDIFDASIGESDQDPDQERDALTEATLARSSPVVDRFRPLMSLNSLDFSVAPSGGMMSYKSGHIRVTLHDKSRLAEVAAFVRPALYGTTHLQIEYGWAHPASKIHGGGEMTEKDNLIGKFIGALRVKEKYQIVNSSFNFDDAGQVEIDMSIAMLSAAAARQTNISFGIETTGAYRRLEELSDMIRSIRSRLDERTAAAITGDQDVLGALSSPSSILSLDKDTRNALVSLSQNTLITRSQTPAVRDLSKALSEFVGTVRGQGKNRPLGTDGAIEAARGSIQGVIATALTELQTGDDPFFLPTAAPSGGESVTITSPTEYVSLGKVVSKFVGSKLAATGKYRDVQIVFYNFNDRSSYMSNRNIASFPIKCGVFSRIMLNAIDRLLDLNLEKFMSLLSQYFLHDPGAEAYGFSTLYEQDLSAENDFSRQLRERYTPRDQSAGRRSPVNLSEDSAAVLEAEERILRTAYRSMSPGQGNPAGEVTFRMPTIQALVETVPVKAVQTQSGGSPTPETILRIHIFDSQATSYATLQAFLEASSDKSITTLNAAGQVALAASNEMQSTAASQNSPAGERRTGAVYDVTTQLLAAQQAGLIEPWPPQERPTLNIDAIRPDPGQRYRMKGGFSALKEFISRSMPSMRYGQGASGILKASVSTMSDGALASVNMLRQAKSPDSPTGHRAQGLPLQIAPVECSLETIGCPLWNFGQQVFIDFGTGTTVDGIYGVVGIDHSLSPGDFKTSVKLMSMNSYAKYISMFDQLENVLTAIEGIDSPNNRRG